MGKKNWLQCHYLFLTNNMERFWNYLTERYTGRLHHLVVDLILLLAVLFLVGINIVLGAWLYIFSIHPDFTTTVTIPQQVISGELLPISLQYQSGNKGISDVVVKVALPDGYATTDATNVHLTKLAVHETGKLDIAGRFTGNVSQPYRVIVVYSYHYYGQSFSGFTATDFTVATSSLEVVPHLPDTILNNETFTWDVEYHNSSDVERHNVCIQLDLPSAFKLESSTLPINADGIITLETIPAQGSGNISITGSFKNAIGEGSQVVGVKGIDQCGSDKLTQVVISNPVQVLTPRLQLTTIAPSVVNVGGASRYTLSYTNTGDASLDHLQLTTQLNNVLGHDSNLSVSDAGRISGNTIIWTDSNLLPGQTRSQTFTVTTSPALREHNLSWSYSAKATAEISDLGVTTYTPAVSGSSKFNSTLTVSQAARYFTTTGEQLGYGPYPLQAWNVTAERVFWQIQDFTNDLSNVTIHTTLPSQVEWTGHTSVTEGTAMTYDPRTRTVTWHSSSVPSFSHPQGASFEVRILPNSAQVGKNINITNDTTFTARDSFTGTVLTRYLGALRTSQPIIAEGAE